MDQATQVIPQLGYNVFPGAQLSLVAPHTSTGVPETFFSATCGSLVYPGDEIKGSPTIQPDQLYDLASCTKVVATTSAVAWLWERGVLPLETRLGDVLPGAAGTHLESIAVLNLLLHNAGFGPDPVPGFSTSEFACPATTEAGVPLTMSCARQVYPAVLASPLPNAPIGSTYVYSDLSFITLHYIVGRVALLENLVVLKRDACASCQAALKQDPAFEPLQWSCAYEAFVRMYILELGLQLDKHAATFLPQPEQLLQCAPTSNDTTYRHRVVRGAVQDPNTYAMGGISGHAGLFATNAALARFMSSIMFGYPVQLLEEETVALFTTEFNHTQSSRALGWNTNDFTAHDYGWDHQCGSLSGNTFMHIGYTGPMLCGDPERELALVLTTNRVYPNATNERILDTRRALSTAVQEAFDAAVGYVPQE